MVQVLNGVSVNQQKKIVRLFKEGFFPGEACEIVGIERHVLERVRRANQMFDHDCVKAGYEAGIRRGDEVNRASRRRL